MTRNGSLSRHSLSRSPRRARGPGAARRRRRSSPRSRPAPGRSIACGSGRSVRPRRRDASTISPCSRAIRRRSTWRWPRPASTRPPTPAPPSRRSSTTKAPARSAPSRSRRPTPTSCGPAPAKRTTARARRGATASTSPPTAAARGRTWACATASRSRASSSIPVDFNVVYVAALGDLWAAGGERGVYKTTDGGVTWTRALHVDDDTGATELVMDPLEQQDALRRDLPAPAAAVGHERRRARQRHLEVHRCAARRGRRSRPACRPGHKGRIGLDDLSRAIRTCSTPRVEHATRKRRLSHRRRAARAGAS